MSFSLPYQLQFAPCDFSLTSSTFDTEAAIPTKHTGEGDDVSPALSWGNIPEGTQSFAIFCHDPDAPVLTTLGGYGFVHWVLYNIPSDIRTLAEASDAYTTGINDFGNTTYNGPMPPNGHGQHRYYFWIVALDTELTLDAGLAMCELIEKIQPHALGLNRLIGTYQRD